MAIYDANTGDEIGRNELEELYDDWLDEVYEPYVIGEIEFSASTVLKECDPIAYRVYKSDWVDAQIADGVFSEEPITDDDDDNTED